MPFIFLTVFCFLYKWPSVLDYPGQSFISGSCPGFHGVLDFSWIWSLLTLYWKMCTFHSTTYTQR